MTLFYTGASSADQEQPISSKSLGGYVSSTMIPNDIINNLFGSMVDYSAKYKEYRLIAVKNLTGQSITSANIWIESGLNSYGKYRLAAVSPSLDNCNKEIFEKIVSANAKPFYAEFEDANDESTAIQITDPIIENEIFGIWVERTASQYAIDNYDQNKSCDQLANDFNENEEIVTEESVKLIIDFV